MSLGDYDLSVWAKGLVSALVSGFFSGVAVCVVDPKAFDIHQNFGKLLTVCAITGLIGLANYLKQSPLPPTKASEGK